MTSDQINGYATEEENNKIQETVRLLDLEDEEEEEDTSTTTGLVNQTRQVQETLPDILYRTVSDIFSPDPNTKDAKAEASFFRRIKISLQETLPLLPEASRNSTRDLLVWTRNGSHLRALLVISVGTIVLLALSGLFAFMLFFLAATINAIIISFLVSLAAVGGFLAIFFACTTAIYIGALSVAVFVISSATITTIFAVLVATGWVGFFWTVGMATKKGMGLAKQSLSMTGSALSAYSATRRTGHQEANQDME